MRKIFKYIGVYAIITLTVIIAGACDTDTDEIRSGSSLLTPTVTVDATVNTATGPVNSGIIQNPPTSDDMKLRVTSSDGLYTSTWPSIAEYPLREPYRPGIYIVEAFYGPESGEGFDSPYFYGSTEIAMLSGQTAEANIDCHLSNTILYISFTSDFTSAFSNSKAIVHANGGRYFNFEPDEDRLLYVRPGTVSIFLDITTADGQHAEFLAACIENAAEGSLYNAVIDAQINQSGHHEITVSFDRQTPVDTKIEISPEFLSSKAPSLTPIGFSDKTPLSIFEGDTPVNRMSMEISGEKASALILTTLAPSLIFQGWPEEIDLTEIDAETLSEMKSLGFKMTGSGNNITSVDFTDAIKHLRSAYGQASFSLMATGRNGKLSGPLQLQIDVKPVDLSVISISDILMGINTAQAIILCRSGDIKDNLEIDIKNPADGTWENLDITSVTRRPDHDGEWELQFHVEEIASPHAEIRIMYCGEEKARQTINFVSPEFSLEVDAYAQLAVVRINADDQDLIPIITSLANIYVNSQPTIYVRREPDMGLIIVGSLKENTRYDIKATLYDNIAAEGHFTKSVKFLTERALGVPNGSFEKIDKGIRYKNLPSGGRYSQNIVDIFNQQNYATYDQFIPKGWANVNAKTFCLSAANHNTWYMQPSTYSIMDCTEGAYAVCLQTTAWDINGQEIPDYRQSEMPYTNYSKHIPDIANRAAGKIFLGEYRFDPVKMKESYNEGIPFGSRPSSLNGHYRYIPCVSNQSDCALITIEVIGIINGSEIVISHANKKLAAATSYTAFNIPIVYERFGIKATRLKLMISSSDTTGSIAEESAGIITFPNPETSTSLGSTLWIDNLTFSY